MKKAFDKIFKRLEETKDIAHDDSLAEIVSTRIWNKAIHRAKQIVKEVAEEYRDGWIPCSERLPEENIEVLVSVSEIDGSIYTRTSFVQDGIWVIKKTPFHPTVIAWQPLPEPYKEREQNEQSNSNYG